MFEDVSLVHMYSSSFRYRECSLPSLIACLNFMCKSYNF